MNELLTTEDVARIVGLSADTVRLAIKDGDLKASWLRRRWRIRSDDLAAWIDEGQRRPALVESSGTTARPLTPRPRHTPPSGSARDAIKRMRPAA